MRGYRYADGRFWLALPKGDASHDAVARFEGRRWVRATGAWNIPASLRAARFLTAQDLRPLTAATADYVASLAILPPPQAEQVGGRTLFPFQSQGVQWLRQRHRALLHDEQGLGKTIQAVAWAAADKHVIVVCPLAVTDQWREEVERAVRWNPVHVVKRSEKYKPPVSGGWTIVNYERLKNVDLSELGGKYTFIVDEAAFIRNTRTARSKSVLAVGARAEKVLALTGTPVINKPLDLWALFLLLGERVQNEFWYFADRYCGAFQTPYGWDFSGATHLDELSQELAHFALRRTKDQVLTDLPPKLYLDLKLAQTRKGATLAAQVLDEARRGISLRSGQGFASLQELRLECACSKVEPCLEWLAQHWAGGGHKVVLFSSFHRPLEMLVEARAAGREGLFPVRYIHGDVADRGEILKWFRDEPGPCALALSYGVGGVGLNLQHADTVILLDLPWTPAELEQAEDRLHRTGQTKQVQVIRMLTDLPIETQMLAALSRKEDIVEGVTELSKL